MMEESTNPWHLSNLFLKASDNRDALAFLCKLPQSLTILTNSIFS